MAGEERLNKYLSRAGVASRRAAEHMITAGRVTVNGAVVNRLGTKVTAEDDVRLDGKQIVPPSTFTYVALYKPRGYITTLRDPKDRPTVAQLVNHLPVRLYPVGRLDGDSEGLLLLTNDGDFSYRVQHPRFRISKVYRVLVGGRFTGAEATELREGLTLDDGWFVPEGVVIEQSGANETWLRLTIAEGRNRVIRRALGAMGYAVRRLIRVQVGPVTLGRLQPGACRELTEREKRELLS